MILVTGANGNVGRELVRLLASQGVPVRALSRTAALTLPRAVQHVSANLDRVETLEAALAGVSQLFLLSPGPNLPSQDQNAIGAAQKAGVTRVVLLSSDGVSNGTGSGPAHAPGEALLHASGLDWTVLRPSAFMSNALFQWLPTIKSQSAFYQPTGDGRHAAIHPADIAAVAAHVLTSTSHEGRTYELTGPEALNGAEHAQILSEVLGRPIRFVDVPEAAFRAQLQQAGVPEPMLDPILAFYALVKAGKYAKVSSAVGELTGNKARSFAQWAGENVTLLR